MTPVAHRTRPSKHAIGILAVLLAGCTGTQSASRQESLPTTTSPETGSNGDYHYNVTLTFDQLGDPDASTPLALECRYDAQTYLTTCADESQRSTPHILLDWRSGTQYDLDGNGQWCSTTLEDFFLFTGWGITGYEATETDLVDLVDLRGLPLVTATPDAVGRLLARGQAVSKGQVVRGGETLTHSRVTLPTEALFDAFFREMSALAADVVEHSDLPNDPPFGLGLAEATTFAELFAGADDEAPVLVNYYAKVPYTDVEVYTAADGKLREIVILMKGSDGTSARETIVYDRDTNVSLTLPQTSPNCYRGPREVTP